jgi:hypothetical protein
MSTELTFERPGRVQISVSMSAGKRLYVRILQLTGKRFETRCKHLASVQCVDPKSCKLIEANGRWSLDIGETSFDFEPAEAHQIQETFGLQVRHVPASVAS